MSDSSSQLTKGARSASQDAARPTEPRVRRRACTESPVEAEPGLGRGPTITKTSETLSTLTGGIMRAVIQVNVYHSPSDATHGDTLHIKCAGDLSGENICLIVSGRAGAL